MVVQIGKDNRVKIKKEILGEIFQEIKQYKYETGGIIGVGKSGVISVFQFDETYSSNLFEYSPNVDFLNQVINEEWVKQDLEFIGFVHSHLNNSEVSGQDVEYSRDILKTNKYLNYIVLGIIDLSKKNYIMWYKVDLGSVVPLRDYVL